jgi:hypothetical protein
VPGSDAAHLCLQQSVNGGRDTVQSADHDDLAVEVVDLRGRLTARKGLRGRISGASDAGDDAIAEIAAALGGLRAEFIMGDAGGRQTPDAFRFGEGAKPVRIGARTAQGAHRVSQVGEQFSRTWPSSPRRSLEP